MSVGYLADSLDLINVRDLDVIAQARARCTRLVALFAADDAPPNLGDQVVRLTPRRRSGSVVLRNALASEDQEAVA